MSSESRMHDTIFAIPENRIYKATRTWVLWLQGIFMNRAKGDYHWDSVDSETDILITDQEPEQAETGVRPRIVTSRGPASWASTSTQPVYQPDFGSTKKVLSDAIGLSMTISVTAKSGVEAENIAFYIFRLIPFFKSQLARMGGLQAVSNAISITPETKHGQVVPGSSTPDWKTVQIIIPFFIQDVVIATEEDFYSLLNAVTLHMDSNT